MKSDDILRYLLGAIEKKLPDKTKLVEILMKTLSMEKGAIYRRLRGEVPFTFYEVVKIAEELDISLNSFIYSDSVQVDRFELDFVEYTNMNEMDYKQWEDYIALIKSAKDDPHSELAESSNVLPLSIYGGFDSLSKFFLFKYQYLLHESEGRIAFSDIVVSERLLRILQSYYLASKNFANATYVWDNLIFRYLVTDIQFFFAINLISDNEVQEIKEDLFALLDHIETIALTGCFEETGNSVSFYISDINLDADYSYVQINNFCMSHVRTFIVNSVASTDLSSYSKMKGWIDSLKKSSTLITQSGIAYRAEFLKKQRQIISEL
jgi:hypothetical protein